MQKAYLAGGCFWCVEAALKQLKGVRKVQSGYSGGDQTLAKNQTPNYEAVSYGQTDHAESVEVEFDENQISYQDLLNVFFTVHDPTEKDRQGADIGHHYRSGVFYLNEDQKNLALKTIREIQSAFGSPIVTEISPFKSFHPAEAYHDDYYNKNPLTPYCQAVISPKLQKLRAKWTHLLR